jgi:hypothetical protein
VKREGVLEWPGDEWGTPANGTLYSRTFGDDSMTSDMPTTAPVSKTILWAGRIMSALAGLFLIVDGSMKLVKPPFVVEKTVELGYAENVIVSLGVVLVTCTILYFIPQTAVLGAILLTGYLGGAVATHVRAGQGAFEILFPVVFGAILWIGLYLRDPRLRALVPLRR